MINRLMKITAIKRSNSYDQHGSVRMATELNW